MSQAKISGEIRHIRRVSDRLMALIALGLLFVVAAVLLARTTDNIIVADPPIGALVQARTLLFSDCLLYTSPSPRDGLLSRMPSSA